MGQGGPYIMRNKRINKLAAIFIAVLATLVVSGVAMADSKVIKGKPGDTVEVGDEDTVEVEVDAKDKAKPAPKVKAAVKGNSTVEVKDGSSGEPAKPAKAEPVAPKIMADDFTSTSKAEDEVDTDSVVELAVRGNLAPTGPAVGGTLGFSYRPANRVRLYAGFNAGKGLIELKGEEKELLQFGFTAGVSRVVTRTVEAGLFGTMAWSYRELTKATSTSFIGIGPGFRLNKLGGLVFFEAGIPIGFSKKFADGSWDWSTMLQSSAGIHF